LIFFLPEGVMGYFQKIFRPHTGEAAKGDNG
jgi:hypothetical protein